MRMGRDPEGDKTAALSSIIFETVASKPKEKVHKAVLLFLDCTVCNIQS